jgi:periplasmic protein CpxP/Spy
MGLFAAATLDKAAIEKQRADHLSLQDRRSKRVTAYLTDSAEVLTPAQRAKIAQHMKSRMEGRGQRGN